MSNDSSLFPDANDVGPSRPLEAESAIEQSESPRLRRPDRRQVLLEPTCLDERLPMDHPARLIWVATGKLDLSAFYEPLKARGTDPGRAATDPQLLIALWLYAHIDNVGCGRELARRCTLHDAYRWLCGGVSVNYHTLNDFRVGHAQALDDLFTEVLARLVHHGVVQLDRMAQDGTRVRASAGASSFRRRPTLEAQRTAARAHVEALRQQAQEPADHAARRQAAQQRAARNRLARLESALAEMPKVETTKALKRDDEPSKWQPARISTTDPEARKMKMPNGGFNPAYNVQIGSDPRSRAIVAIDVTNHGTDFGEDRGLRVQVERRTGHKVCELLLDGGFVKKVAIQQAAAEQVTWYAPLPKKGLSGAVCTRNRKDSPAITAWRERMRSPAGQLIYKQRAATAETINADLKTFRGMGRFVLRGLAKCRCTALWAALAYNLMHFATQVINA